MRIKILQNSEELGREAASYAATVLNKTIDEKGTARLLLSTGASQFDTLKALVETNVDWSRVEMFHLDEYVNLPESHPASFRKYLKEKFVSLIPLKQAYFVNAQGNVQENIRVLTDELRKAPVDLALIGIGENAHIAFNDPPANFDTKEAYIVVDLDERCKKQQVGEGWFPHLDAVPKQAVSMTVYQILQSREIISCVPHSVKAEAIQQTLENELTQLVPATALKGHRHCTLFIDENSASLVSQELLKRYQ